MTPEQLADQTAKAKEELKMRGAATGDWQRSCTMVQGAWTIKEEGNVLHNQGKYAEAAEKYQAAKRNLEGNNSPAALQVNSYINTC
jgi:hypothetical protein